MPHICVEPIFTIVLTGRPEKSSSSGTGGINTRQAESQKSTRQYAKRF
jgi:hypothetical protein